jgi:hypothetical protein
VIRTDCERESRNPVVAGFRQFGAPKAGNPDFGAGCGKANPLPVGFFNYCPESVE